MANLGMLLGTVAGKWGAQRLNNIFDKQVWNTRPVGSANPADFSNSKFYTRPQYNPSQNQTVQNPASSTVGGVKMIQNPELLRGLQNAQNAPVQYFPMNATVEPQYINQAITMPTEKVPTVDEVNQNYTGIKITRARSIKFSGKN